MHHVLQTQLKITICAYLSNWFSKTVLVVLYMGICFCRRETVIPQTIQSHKKNINPIHDYVEEYPKFWKKKSINSKPQSHFFDKGSASGVNLLTIVQPLAYASVTYAMHDHKSNELKAIISSSMNIAPNTDLQRRPSMANTISNMKMTNPIKELVSKKKKRYTKDGFNLDLTYIQPNLIAMGYPAERLEGVYRNHIDDVVKLLETKHQGHYKIYNLCSERSYDCNKFKQRVATYPFDDHNPPEMEIIQPFCADVHDWLSKDARNVAAVHCKAGKGRTGTMVCCYMLHSMQFLTSSDALNHYAQKRTHDCKGVTIPSQRRYVDYYARLVHEHLVYTPTVLQISEIILQPAPILSSAQENIHFSISESSTKMYSSLNQDSKKGVGVLENGNIYFRLDQCIPLSGDIKLEFFTKSKMMRREKLFHFWFNTFFVRDKTSTSTSSIHNDSNTNSSSNSMSMSNSASTINQPTAIHNLSLNSDNEENCDYFGSGTALTLILDKYELDDAHKDKTHKLYSADFKVVVKMHRVPSTGWLGSTRHIVRTHSAMQQETPSESSEASSSEDSNEEYGWESGECPLLLENQNTNKEHQQHATGLKTHTRHADAINRTGAPFVLSNSQIFSACVNLMSRKNNASNHTRPELKCDLKQSECPDPDKCNKLNLTNIKKFEKQGEAFHESDDNCQQKLEPSTPHRYANSRLSLGVLESRKMSLDRSSDQNVVNVRLRLPTFNSRPRREST